jgi:hypothetical protein
MLRYGENRGQSGRGFPSEGFGGILLNAHVATVVRYCPIGNWQGCSLLAAASLGDTAFIVSGALQAHGKWAASTWPSEGLILMCTEARAEDSRSEEECCGEEQ